MKFSTKINITFAFGSTANVGAHVSNSQLCSERQRARVWRSNFHFFQLASINQNKPGLRPPNSKPAASEAPLAPVDGLAKLRHTPALRPIPFQFVYKRQRRRRLTSLRLHFSTKFVFAVQLIFSKNPQWPPPWSRSSPGSSISASSQTAATVIVSIFCFIVTNLIDFACITFSWSCTLSVLIVYWIVCILMHHRSIN